MSEKLAELYAATDQRVGPPPTCQVPVPAMKTPSVVQCSLALKWSKSTAFASLSVFFSLFLFKKYNNKQYQMKLSGVRTQVLKWHSEGHRPLPGSKNAAEAKACGAGKTPPLTSICTAVVTKTLPFD